MSELSGEERNVRSYCTAFCEIISTSKTRATGLKPTNSSPLGLNSFQLLEIQEVRWLSVVSLASLDNRPEGKQLKNQVGRRLRILVFACFWFFQLINYSEFWESSDLFVKSSRIVSVQEPSVFQGSKGT